MATAEKFIILPFKKNRGNIVQGEMRQASNAASAEKIAAAMADRFVASPPMLSWWMKNPGRWEPLACFRSTAKSRTSPPN